MVDTMHGPSRVFAPPGPRGRGAGAAEPFLPMAVDDARLQVEVGARPSRPVSVSSTANRLPDSGVAHAHEAAPHLKISPDWRTLRTAASAG